MKQTRRIFDSIEITIEDGKATTTAHPVKLGMWGGEIRGYIACLKDDGIDTSQLDVWLEYSMKIMEAEMKHSIKSFMKDSPFDKYFKMDFDV